MMVSLYAAADSGTTLKLFNLLLLNILLEKVEWRSFS
jgi:hypothetical protein